ncbi:hypothetical protein ACKF11_12745 [Methylobacillus sp. Pita2]|uniref:hypothetical protein n=1 Tax=Methylobacillus sp. Pita2 TaxID=3383245 RepID=UPI0038B419DE
MKAFRQLQLVILASAIASGAPITSLAAWEGATQQANHGFGSAQSDAATEQSEAPTGEAVVIPQKIKEGMATIGGAVAGALLGSQVGGGNGSKVMSVVGGIAGGVLGKSLASSGGSFKDPDGRQWTNGDHKMDPKTELPKFQEMVIITQVAFMNYARAANAASLARNDYDWNRISEASYLKMRDQMERTGQAFYSVRRGLNEMAVSVTGRWNKKIESDQLAVLQSCNLVPIGNSDMVTYAAVIEKGEHCAIKKADQAQASF